MFKRLLIVAVLAITLISVPGAASVAAVGNATGNNGNSQVDDKKDKEEKKETETHTPPVIVPAPFPVIIPPITPAPIITPTPANDAGDDKKDEKVKEEKTPKEEKGEKKITICHRTNAPKNPYRLITVSKKSVDGEGKSDHTHHTGPIATSFEVAKALKAAGIKWGDIIPQEGDYIGKAIFDNKCKYTTINPTPVASIDSDVVCDVVNQRAVITLTNTGSIGGVAIVNGATVGVSANGEAVTYVPTPAGKVRVVVNIDGVIEYDEELDCRTGGQGGGSTTPTPTPAVTPTTPVAGAGESAAIASANADIASLPYTAGNGVQIVALIAGLAAVLTAAISIVAKKTYLKQV
jgi:hypothetical protein